MLLKPQDGKLPKTDRDRVNITRKNIVQKMLWLDSEELQKIQSFTEKEIWKNIERTR